MRFHWSVLALASLSPLCRASADDLPARFSVIAVAPATTSIFVGRLTVTPSLFVREATDYKARLGIELWPYGFHDEAKVVIVVGNDQLGQLAGGHPVAFTGHVTRRNGQTRRISGRAVPTGPDSGKLDIRVFLTSQMTISFSTTYQVRQPAP